MNQGQDVVNDELIVRNKVSARRHLRCGQTVLAAINNPCPAVQLPQYTQLHHARSSLPFLRECGSRHVGR